MTIDILCSVVDNFGDIGVVYRLAKALSGLGEDLELRLIVDDLAAFRALCPEVEPGAEVQTVKGWTVAAWDAPRGEARRLFRAPPPRAVVECFACGRPEWFEDILFDPEDPEDRLIVDLEYLTAEDWAAEFHRLPSATRSAKVKKALFMPGFATGTGGLILDGAFAAARTAYLDRDRRPSLRNALLRTIEAAGAVFLSATPGAGGPGNGRDATEAFWVTLFSYERDYAPFLRSLADAADRGPLLVVSAAGRSAAPFKEAWEAAGRPFPLIELPFLSQELWDEAILAADFAVVRGEDSLSRAALSGRPFLWNAYPLEDGAQLAKVRALLDRMRPAFPAADFSLLEGLWLDFNGDVDAAGGGSALAELLARCGGRGRLDAAFYSWSESLLKRGDLARGLLTFIRDFG